MTSLPIASRASVMALVIALAASRTALGGEVSPAAGDNPIGLPVNFKQTVAVNLVTEYVKDGVGPAMISEPSSSKGLLGEAAWAVIRYPVKDNGLFASSGGTTMRCIKVVAERSISTGGTTRSKVIRSRTDGEGCSGSDKVGPYVELERVAAKLRACRTRGEERCLLSTSMPEAEARKLMKLH